MIDPDPVRAKCTQTRQVSRFLALSWRGGPAGFVAFGVSVLLLVALLGPPAAAAEETGKGGRLYLWVIRNALEDTLAFAALVDSARAAGVTDLLLQVRGRGEAYYRSATEPAPRNLEVVDDDHLTTGSLPSESTLRYDPLRTAIRICRRSDMRVHAWVNLFLAGEWKEARSQHVLVRHPDWRIRMKGGELPSSLSASERRRLGFEGDYLNPGDPRVLAYLRSVVHELVWRYLPDGIHFDYVRYPYADSGYDPISLDLYREERGREDSGFLVSEEDEDWNLWRAERVSATVEALAAAVRSASAAIEVSAAVLPDPAEAYDRCHQDWPRWVREGWCDFVIQMAYTRSPDRLAFWREVAVSRVRENDRVLLGLGLHRLDSMTLGTVLGDLRSQGVSSLAIFSDVEFKQSVDVRAVLRSEWIGPSTR